MTIQDALTCAKEKLSHIACHPSLDAELLLSYAMKKPRSFLFAWPNQHLTQEEKALFAEYIKRRSHNEPLAYIVGHREFWSLSLLVDEHTLIPRPETELLVETILQLSDEKNACVKVADLGTGSGAIALALAHERPAWQICATDVSEKALQIARKNAQRFNLQNISFYEGSWCTALPMTGFDIIVSNPPYIAETEWSNYSRSLQYEPKSALVSGEDGLDAIRILCKSAKNYMRPGGHLLIEHGFSQGEAVSALFVSAEYQNVCSKRDLAGKERITMGCKP